MKLISNCLELIKSTIKWRIYLLRTYRYRHLPRWNLREVCGVKLLLDGEEFVDSKILQDNVYQEDVVSSIFDYIKNYNVIYFFDIGSNIGQHAIFVKYNFPDVLVNSFEPCHVTYCKNRINVLINGLNISVFNCALSNVRRLGRLYYRMDNNSGANSLRTDIIYGHNRVEDSEEVKVETLDSLFNFRDKVILIKIDAEGSELNILMGGIELLKNNKCIVIYESVVVTSNDVADLLSIYGYVYKKDIGLTDSIISNIPI